MSYRVKHLLYWENSILGSTLYTRPLLHDFSLRVQPTASRGLKVDSMPLRWRRQNFMFRERLIASICAIAIPLSLLGPGLAQAEPESSVPADGVIVQVAPSADVVEVIANASSNHVPPVDEISGPAFTGGVVASDAVNLQELDKDPRVLGVEPNQILSIYANSERKSHSPQPYAKTAAGSAKSWGLDRIDQRRLPLDGRFSPAGQGAGTHVYVVDSGIDLDHPAFSGRMGRSTVVASAGSTADDCDGHGTHVAGSALSASHGIASSATVHSVRVLGCDGEGTLAGIIEGLNWVAQNAETRSIVNLSLGGKKSDALNAAARKLTSRGVAVVTASGNSSLDACTFSPASVESVLTVGAANRKDEEANFSNYGSCVDVYAPGVEITSLAKNDPGGEVQMSGTSMAAPHVAGVLAVLWGKAPSLSAAEAQQLLLNLATSQVMEYPWGRMSSPNRNLHLPTGFPVSSTNAQDPPAKAHRVQNLRAKRKSQRLKVTWQRPVDMGATNIKYGIQLTDKNSGKKSAWHSTKKTKYLFKNKDTSRYLIRVKTRTSVDDSKARKVTTR
jgi:subtilisin family serine protease